MPVLFLKSLYGSLLLLLSLSLSPCLDISMHFLFQLIETASTHDWHLSCTLSTNQRLDLFIEVSVRERGRDAVIPWMASTCAADNHVLLGLSKTKEPVVDSQHSRTPLTPVTMRAWGGGGEMRQELPALYQGMHTRKQQERPETSKGRINFSSCLCSAITSCGARHDVCCVCNGPIRMLQ